MKPDLRSILFYNQHHFLLKTVCFSWNYLNSEDIEICQFYKFFEELLEGTVLLNIGPCLCLQLRNAITAETMEQKLQLNENSIIKVIRLYKTKTSRHSAMIMSGTHASKTTTWCLLQGSMTSSIRTVTPPSRW